MAGLWMGGMLPSQDSDGTSEALKAERAASYELKTQLTELLRHVERLALLNQALWELIRTKLSLTDDDLEQMARQVDLRDGREDGQITAIAVQCPSCRRICNSKHDRCLYCGQLFEKPIFG